MTNASNVVVDVVNNGHDGAVNTEESETAAATAALTKVFVGGLAWETQKDSLRQHFEKYGEILEAVIIYDKLTGRSKGYGFVTFTEPEAAKSACEDASPTINGRRANCNLAALGARSTTSRGALPSPYKRSPSSTPPLPALQQGLVSTAASNFNRVAPGGGKQPAAPHHVQWYFYPGASQAVPALIPPSHQYHHHAAQHQTAVAPAPLPFYGYSPVMYVATDYSQKANYGGGYMNVQPHPAMYTWQQAAAMVGQLPTTAATNTAAAAAPVPAAASGHHHTYIPIMHPHHHHQGAHNPYYHHQYLSPINNYHHHQAAVASMGFPTGHRVISPSAVTGRIASQV